MPSVCAKLDAIERAVTQARLIPVSGYLTHVGSTVVKAVMQGARQGAVCRIERAMQPPLLAEIIAIKSNELTLCPFGSTENLSEGAMVQLAPDALSIVTQTALLGRVVDPFGVPIDGKGAIDGAGTARAIKAGVPSAMDRPMIDTMMTTGLRCIDGLLTLGRGQRIAVFGSPGTGKSTLLSAIARHSQVDVVVVGMVGERGREVQEFISRDLPPEVRKNVCIVAATSDRPAMERALCAQSATAVAEAFRDQGKSVLLLIDSLTRTARALREIGLAAGEPPVRRGYPASVYPALPAIIERAGRSKTGDITAIYTVLTEGDGPEDPIAEEVRSLTDGHITLSRDLAEEGHYPAIDVLASLSRTMPAVVDAAQIEAANQIRGDLARYRDVELLLQVGEYSKGADAAVDRAVDAKPRISAFLRQSAKDATAFQATRNQLQQIAS